MHIGFHKHILQFKQPAGTSRGVYHNRKLWYVTAYDDHGSWGIGECAPLPDLSCDAMSDEHYEALLAEACRTTAESDGHIDYARLRPYPSILFGIETALLSLSSCKRNHNPYCLYDNPFSRGTEGTRINGLVWMGNYEEMMQRMEEKLALGFHCIKIKIGAIDWCREISLIRALRQRYSREVVEIRVDANGGFSTDVAMRRLQELARYDIHSIEQPIRQRQWTEMAGLCSQSPIPVALDEELIGVNDKEDKALLLDTIRPHYIILKPSLHGGLYGCEEWISLAKERGIGFWVTSALESNVGLNAIAQWQKKISYENEAANPSLKDFPQGLGTGQLFVKNYDAIHLEINGECLWCGSEKARAFRLEHQVFLAEWCDESPKIIVHTSGSTGQPKSIEVEKRRMQASALMTLRFLRLSPGDSALLCMPLRYIAGKMMVVRTIVGNLSLRLIPPTSHPLRTLAIEKAHGNKALPKFLALTPMQALATLEVEAEKDIFQRIPCIIIGGGAITPRLHAALQCCQGEVYSTYGMTETLSHIAMRRLNGPDQCDTYTPLPGVKITTNNNGCLVIDASDLCPNTLVTNDLCKIHPDGTFSILGRRDNVICSGGIKLSLETLESKLGEIGCPYMLTYVNDAHLGEALALIHTKQRPDESLFLSRLDQYERPRHIIRVKRLPLTETGKPARAEAHGIAEEALHAALVGTILYRGR